MKCIKNQTTGEIRRVKDEVAYELETKGWGYIPKSEWKEQTRPQVIVKEAKPNVSSEGKPRRTREKKNKK